MQILSTPDSHQPIGVFDSGVGGLSVLQCLLGHLPDEQFVYVADSGYGPYGERDEAHVITRAMGLARYLIESRHAKMLVVACNTATAQSVTALRKEWQHIPILGVEPALKPAAALTRTGKVAVLATRGTLKSTKFQGLLQSLSMQACFTLQPADGLAYAIEQGDTAEIQALCRRYLQAVGPFGHGKNMHDTLVLGCTHYPFAQGVMQAMLPEHILMLETGNPVAEHAGHILQQRGLNTHIVKRPSHVFLSTGDPTLLENAALRWLGVQCRAERIA